jgi:hypothetical protein
MSNVLIFVWGIIAFSLAVGPLIAAAYLDRKDKTQE